MLDCFIDYVGLQTCANVYGQSPSGLYLTQLPGLTLDNINSIADEGQRTWRGVFEDVQKIQLRVFQRDVTNQLNACYELNDECNYEEDIFCDDNNMLILSTAWMYLLGVGIMTERLYSPRLNKYTTIDRKQAEELRDHYQVEYEKALVDGVKALDTSKCELCCGGNPEVVTYLP